MFDEKYFDSDFAQKTPKLLALQLDKIQVMSQERIEAIKAAIAAADASTPDELEAYRVEYISKKSVVGELFASLTRDQLIARLDKADIAYGEVNSAQDLSAHPHLRRIEVDSPGGRIAMPAPAPIVIGESRSYGAVPAAGVDTATFLKQSGSTS